jgi:hypothetical protein
MFLTELVLTALMFLTELVIAVLMCITELVLVILKNIIELVPRYLVGITSHYDHVVRLRIEGSHFLKEKEEGIRVNTRPPSRRAILENAI